MNAQTWLDDGLLCATKWHFWPSQPLTFDSGLTLTPEQTRYTVALNPFVRACVGKSRESSLSPSPWHTQRENGSFGRPAQGRKNRAQRGGEEVTVQKVTLPPSKPRDLFSSPRDELQVDFTSLPSWRFSCLFWLCLLCLRFTQSTWQMYSVWQNVQHEILCTAQTSVFQNAVHLTFLYSVKNEP